MKKFTNQVNLDNIVTEKRNRVTSNEGIWSMICTNQIKGVFYSKNEEKLLKNSKRKPKSNIENIEEETKENSQNNSKEPESEKKVMKKAKINKLGKKIRRKKNQESKNNNHIEKKDNEEKTMNFHEDPPILKSEFQEKAENNTKSNNLNSEKNIEKNGEQPQKKKQKMKSIHIADPSQVDKFLKVLKDHIGIIQPPKN